MTKTFFSMYSTIIYCILFYSFQYTALVLGHKIMSGITCVTYNCFFSRCFGAWSVLLPECLPQ